MNSKMENCVQSTLGPGKLDLKLQLPRPSAACMGRISSNPLLVVSYATALAPAMNLCGSAVSCLGAPRSMMGNISGGRINTHQILGFVIGLGLGVLVVGLGVRLHCLFNGGSSSRTRCWKVSILSFP